MIVIHNPQTWNDEQQSRAVHWMERMRLMNSRELGFVPLKAYREGIPRGRVLLAETAGVIAGFLLFTHTKTKGVKVMQIAVHPDYRRQHIGTSLMLALAERHADEVLTLWCRADLDANNFWKAMVMKVLALNENNNKERIALVRWGALCSSTYSASLS